MHQLKKYSIPDLEQIQVISYNLYIVLIYYSGNALEFAATNLLNPDFGARSDSAKITIVITDGKSDDNIHQSAKILHKRSNVSHNK